ncbi:aldehyde dehydrogenase family protein [Rhodococcus qingshengii]|jgi:succinate-semialdehyde dehydrogenase/glutarate-semialdehyde dehydrogenase|uniref:aldehyde dehydrogenase family protein n=4 Tax=cellular organisms TaxID=131567 RepID=UPI0001A219D8|nr:aldehyde dehydrogenase family protein [Rhodococcus qingshengii]EEN86489.1 aldehyde dehydrogenase (NAD) family protein [Rhodococcus erythropolis SK121]MDN5544712.1 aldehyde dehydrogenase family protein [Rhodococcus sp. (in: high G+C Gram-positive bacteria)]
MTVSYAVTNPRTGDVVSTYPTATAEDVENALAATSAAYRGWSKSSTVAERAALMWNVANLFIERKDELAAIVVREMGKSLVEAVEECELSAWICDYYASNAERFLADEEIEIRDGEGSACIRRSAVGSLLGIMPWNLPFYQVARFAGPNLVLGNTIILKHAPQCPESSAALAELFVDAGFPVGAYVNLYATNEQVAQIIADPRNQGVSVTGSERAGSAVAEIAGRNLKKVVLELGGSDPFILLSTDDMDAAAGAAAGARATNTGQICNAGKRFIVAEGLYDEFVPAFSDKLYATSRSTPLVSVQAAEILADQVAQAVAAGATYTAADAGGVDGAFHPAGILTDVAPDNPVYSQELFGPVAMVFKVGSEEEAVRLANDSPFGLGSYVFTTDPVQAQRVADQLEVGMVFVNGVGVDAPELPFGGIKRSGFGRELGRYGVEEFVNKKLVRVVS